MEERMKEIDISKNTAHWFVCQQCKKEFGLSVYKYGWDLDLFYIPNISPICKSCLELNASKIRFEK